MKHVSMTVWSFAFIVVLISFSYAGQSDTLKVLKEFSAPIENPTILAWDGNHFWTGKMGDSRIYKLDGSMAVSDSIDTRRSRVRAICFKGEELWIAVDSSVGVSQKDGNRLFRIYRVGRESKRITDSVSFSPKVNPPRDTGFILGLCYWDVKNLFYVSVDFSGWNSGTYFIDTSKEMLNAVSFVPLLGIADINNEIWGIKRDAGGNEGVSVAHILKWPKSPFVTTFSGIDIAYNGKNIFICNRRDSKIMEMDTPQSFAVPSPDSLKETLYGSWNWIFTIGGIGGVKTTPLSEHYTLTLQFAKNIPPLPSDAISYRIFRNDSCILSAVASIRLHYDSYYPKWILGMEPFGHHFFSSGADVGGNAIDTLVIADAYVYDGYSSTFAKQAVQVMDRPKAPPAQRSLLPSVGSSGRFTLLGRRLNQGRNGRCAFPAQIEVSKSKTEVTCKRKR